MVQLNGARPLSSPDLLASSPSLGSLIGRRSVNPSEGPSRVSPSNTLILTSLPTPLFHPEIQRHLRAHFSSYGNISTWAPLAGLGRIIVVYTGDEDVEEDGDNAGEVEQQSVRAADRAKRDMDRFQIDFAPTDEFARTSKSTMRVYFGPMTPLTLTSPPSSRRHSLPVGVPRHQQHLAPPTLDKNFLISPPGSPPVGWQQVREDGPNKQTLAEDLSRALRYLSVGEGGDAMDTSDDVVIRSDEDEEILSDEADVVPEEHDLVIVTGAPEMDVPALRVQRSPTPIPPFATEPTIEAPPARSSSIGQVKATVESMQGAFDQRITPTSRPPPMGAY